MFSSFLSQWSAFIMVLGNPFLHLSSLTAFYQDYLLFCIFAKLKYWKYSTDTVLFWFWNEKLEVTTETINM